MLNLTRLHLGIAHESQFQGLGIRGLPGARRKYWLAGALSVMGGPTPSPDEEQTSHGPRPEPEGSGDEHGWRTLLSAADEAKSIGARTLLSGRRPSGLLRVRSHGQQ